MQSVVSSKLVLHEELQFHTDIKCRTVCLFNKDAKVTVHTEHCASFPVASFAASSKLA